MLNEIGCQGTNDQSETASVHIASAPAQRADASARLAATIGELIAANRQRQFCMKAISRCDRSCESFIARQIGFTRDMGEAKRKAVWGRATAFRKYVEAEMRRKRSATKDRASSPDKGDEGSGGEGQIPGAGDDAGHRSYALSSDAPAESIIGADSIERLRLSGFDVTPREPKKRRGKKADRASVPSSGAEEGGGEGQFMLAGDAGRVTHALSSDAAEPEAIRFVRAFLATQAAPGPAKGKRSKKANPASSPDGDGGSGGEGRLAPAGDDAGHTMTALSSCIPVITESAKSRAQWDALLVETEKRMARLAKTLPVYPWVAAVRGLRDMGLAIIVAEAGDLANYPDKHRLWKRLGLGVLNGERQQKKTDAALASQHGYSPSRRAAMWNIAEPLLRAQWRSGDKDAGEAGYAIGPYGEVYARRKQIRTAANDAGAFAEWAAALAERSRRAGSAPAPENAAGRLTRKHMDTDARRIMFKALIKDLWVEWRRIEREARPL